MTEPELMTDAGDLARREALEDEADFLQRSLDDLEREREAGDIEERDYLDLRAR